jgi:hypothetical protein
VVLLLPGRIERGVINTGDPVEIIGMMAEDEKPLTSVVTGVEMFRKILTAVKLVIMLVCCCVVLKRRYQAWYGYL